MYFKLYKKIRKQDDSFTNQEWDKISSLAITIDYIIIYINLNKWISLHRLKVFAHLSLKMHWNATTVFDPKGQFYAA